MQTVYEVPAAASGDAGLEGFSVETASGRAGRVAALNSTPGGLVLLVDTGDAYRPLPLRAVARVEMLGRRVLLTPGGEVELAASPAAEVRVLRVDSPRLVRHLPRELDPLLVEGEPPRPRDRPRGWLAGTLLGGVGGLAVFIGAPLAATGVGGSLRWLWVAAPAVLLVAGLALLWRALDPAAGRRLSPLEKAADVVVFFFGISPRTRKRG